MRRNTESDALSFDMKWLKKYGYLSGYKSGGIKWSGGFGGEDSLCFIVNTISESPAIRFQYTITQRWTDEKKDMDFSHFLVRVPCNLGGFRWAFRCGLSVDGRYCGRLAYKFYNGAGSDYYGCRKCMDIYYDTQKHSRSRFEALGKALMLEKKFIEIKASVRKWKYQGKPTKKVYKLMDMKRKIDVYNSWISKRKWV